MPRDADQPVQVPGAAAEANDAAVQAGIDRADTIEALKAQLAAQAEQIAVLTAKAAAAPTIKDGTVFEPVTRHGAQAMAASEFRALTTDQVHALVLAGKVSLQGKPSVLCADGYYCDPSYR